MKLRAAIRLVLLSAVTLGACSYPTRNEIIVSTSGRAEYKYVDLELGNLGDTLVVVTASGGGTRAAALTMAVLKSMNKIRLKSGGTLAEEIDILSSVSGGSVAAAYFAWKGPAGFATFDSRFLEQDGMSALIGRGIAELPALATPSRERIDILIDYFDDQLFGKVTYKSLIDNKRGPYLILNAADMVEGSPFPFTQYTMDLICSDLAKMKLSTAVAASAAFPVAFSPVTLTNYRPAPAGMAWAGDETRTPKCDRRMPGWLDPAGKTEWYSDPPRVMWRRTAAPYATGHKRYIHLLDGGIADNLGINEPLRLLTSDDASPLLKQQISRGEIKKIVFVVINARSAPPSALDTTRATPGIIDMLRSSINASLDRATFNMAERLRALLNEQFSALALEARELKNPQAAANFMTVARNTYLIPVDFSAIDDPACRTSFFSIGTNWALPPETIKSLTDIGEALLAQHPQFRAMLAAVGAVDPAQPFLGIDQACNPLPVKGKS